MRMTMLERQVVVVPVDWNAEDTVLRGLQIFLNVQRNVDAGTGQQTDGTGTMVWTIRENGEWNRGQMLREG